MENFGLSNSQNVLNSYLAAVYANGEIIQNNEGVSYQGPPPKLFRIPLQCTLTSLKRRICHALGIAENTQFRKLYYRKPSMIGESFIKYEIIPLLTDVHVTQMISWKCNFPRDVMFEFYALFLRSPDEIISLLNPPNTTSSSNPEAVPVSKAIIYYGGPFNNATIMDCPQGYGLMYKCDRPKKMLIQHDWTFNQLVNNITELLDCHPEEPIIHIDYRRPYLVDDGKRLIHDTMSIRNDDDVRHMITTWKETAPLPLRIHQSPTADWIELFVQQRSRHPWNVTVAVQLNTTNF